MIRTPLFKYIVKMYYSKKFRKIIIEFYSIERWEEMMGRYRGLDMYRYYIKDIRGNIQRVGWFGKFGRLPGGDWGMWFTSADKVTSSQQWFIRQLSKVMLPKNTPINKDLYKRLLGIEPVKYFVIMQPVYY